uniref:MFS transporter n=1 Tax=Thermomonas sp. TaxID=1971895 RepID=UPI0035ADDCB8
AYAPGIGVAVPAMMVTGAAWITVANSLTVAAQMALPDWVRARGMSIYQMALMGATAAGAALWGQVATWTDVHHSIGLACLSSVVLAFLVRSPVTDRPAGEDMAPAPILPRPDLPAPEQPGRILVHVEYIIDPARTAEFLAVMQRSRRSRLSLGALDWQLLHDMAQPDRYVEQIVDASWTEHLRRFDRFSGADAELRARRLACHVGDGPPRVTRYQLTQE